MEKEYCKWEGDFKLNLFSWKKHPVHVTQMNLHTFKYDPCRLTFQTAGQLF